MSIRGKIILGHLAIVIFMCLAGYFSLKGIRSIRTSFSAVHGETVPAIEALENLRFAGLRIVSSVSEYGLIRAEHNRAPVGRGSAARQEEEEERLIAEGEEGYRRAFKDYEKISAAFFPEDREMLSLIARKGGELRETGLKVVKLSRAGTRGEAVLEAKEAFEAAENAFLAAIRTSLLHHKSELENRRLAVEADFSSTMTGMLLLNLLAGTAAFVIGGFLSHNISSRLLKLKYAAAKIEAGDLRTRLRVSPGDELEQLGKAFNNMAESLFRATERLNGVLQNMANPLAVTDSEGRVLMVNRSLTETLGCSSGELLGTPALNMFAPDSPPPPLGRAGVSSPAVPELVRDLEARLLAKDGRKVPVLVSTSALSGEDGGFQGLITVMKDMTARKEIEARMRHSEKIAAVGQLAAGIAHEINNPIGIILGFAQSVAKRIAAEDPLSVPLRTIEREALRCKDFVHGILNFSRSAGDEEAREACINSVVETAAPLIMAQCKMRGIELSMSLSEGLERVPLYASALQQAVINLCTNAIDSMGAGGTLTIRTSRKSCESGNCLVLEVSDTGCGIPEGDIPRLFEPFFTTKEPGKGTGLGLPLVYESVRRHDGRIDVKSEPGRGSTFTVYLPIKGPAGAGNGANGSSRGTAPAGK